jgi:hypothetical protein
MGEFSAKSPFDAVLHTLDQIDCADKVHYQTISGYLRELIFTGYRLVIFIQHSNCKVGGSQIYSYFQLPRKGGFKRCGFRVIHPVEKFSSAA